MLAIAATASADEMSFRSVQSGWDASRTPVTDHGIHGEGQIIAVLDTGVDYDSCFFAEPDNSPPPINTGTPAGGLEWRNIDLSRRKIIAYDFLYSCDQFPGATGCENPADITAYDNIGHGSHNAAIATGDSYTPIHNDLADALATGAKLVVQDGGYLPSAICASQRPGFGCPINITPLLDQAYKQGARIHTNSWGDRQGAAGNVSPPVGNYAASSRDVDAFVYAHPDMLVVFNTGNYGATGDVPPTLPPKMSVAAPGTAKNAIQVGGTRPPRRDDSVLGFNTLYGPTRDGRIKPEVVAPMTVVAGDWDFGANTRNCNISEQGPGTSWSAPSVASAAALVRQYYQDGFYPTGVANAANAFTPSAALLKASIIAAARRVPLKSTINGDVATLPVPSYEQGWGFPVLDDVLYFPGDASRLRVVDDAAGLAAGETASVKLTARSTTAMRAVLVWTDPPGVPRTISDPTPELVNDLDLVITRPDGTKIYGNDAVHPGQPDRINNTEVVTFDTPQAGMYQIDIVASTLKSGSRQSYALVITGDIADPGSPRIRAVRH